MPFVTGNAHLVHHTFDQAFSQHNCVELLDNMDFIESLKVCKGIFVLSNHLKVKMEKELMLKNITVPVFSFVHPTESNIKQWQYDFFLENKDKQLINIGAWLRNIFFFYYLTLPDEYTFSYKINFFCNGKIKDNIRKVCLKGGYMDNYFPSTDFTKDVAEFLRLEENNQFPFDIPNASRNIVASSTSTIVRNISDNVSDPIVNNWYKHFYDYISNTVNSVDIISQLSNEEYDDLLTKNIVFINLVDASAVNTIIECIVRCTPIVVNDHPAVVDMLGKYYPLYYQTDNLYNMNKQIESLLVNTENIKNANKYLKKLDKSKYTIQYFTNQLTDIINGL